MNKRVAAFGEVMMRMQVPGFDLLSQADTLKYSFSGTGVNVASALSRFGHTASLVTILPDNALGEAAKSYVQKLGITSQFITRQGQYLGMYFLENGFGVRSSRVTYTNRLGSTFNTASADAYDYDTIAQNIDAIHFCGIALSMNDGVRQHMVALANSVKKQGGLVIFDCNYRPSLWGEQSYERAKPYYEKMLTLSDIVFMNEKDALLTLAMQTQKTTRHDQLLDLLPQIAEKYAISVIAGTHRAINGDNTNSLRGFMLKNDQFTFADELVFSVYDRIGAGDAYASGIIHGQLTNMSASETVAFAASASMLAHTTVGDTPMSTIRDVEQAMQGFVKDVER
ncbi:sugar kinase [Kurthia sibirica]|uniref:2-dehydro-3-deoxygluconokinase n=1 Tax=Kurthia sibirica TaxID=202750 RepID=A0A2U3AP64_9BACL|nr:sugar kinase [Kurthia sibirica]PWI26321.1 2-dehydro-3-deoxygluconokinase [Kurthia sibirica]GEK35011.1 2-dehydro-3-deoxygluconokinase [Kurthia sibirica]